MTKLSEFPANLPGAGVCFLATAADLKGPDFRLQQSIRAFGSGGDVKVWVIRGVQDKFELDYPHGIHVVAEPEGTSLLVIQTVEALQACLVSQVDPKRCLVWMAFDQFCSEQPGPLLALTIEHLRRSCTVIALNESDADEWASALGRRPSLIDIDAIERRRMRTAEPLIERGATPRIMIDLCDTKLSERETEAYLAVEGEACEVWHVHDGELQPWMRPDMQFLIIAKRDRGLFYQSIDAAFIDEAEQTAAERIKDYTTTGVFPIPLEDTSLCRPLFRTLGLESFSEEVSLKSRVQAYLKIAEQADLRHRIASYADAESGLVQEDESLMLRFARAHAEQHAVLAVIEEPSAVTRSRQSALALASQSWLRWDEQRPALKVQCSERTALSVAGWAQELASNAPCELMVISPKASARLARLPITNLLETSHSTGSPVDPSVFLAVGLLQNTAAGTDYVDPRRLLDVLTIVAVGSTSGDTCALPNEGLALGGSSATIVSELLRQSGLQPSQAENITGRIEHIELKPVKVVSIPSHVVKPGETFLRVFDEDGNPVMANLWLTLEAARHGDLVPLSDASADGMRPIGAELKDLVRQASRLVVWGEVVSLAAAYVYNHDQSARSQTE